MDPSGAADIEVFRHRLSAVAEQMGGLLGRAAYSPNIRERRDYSCAVFDGAGRLLAQAAHIPVHLGALEASVKAAAIRNPWQRGDTLILNDPYSGGSHLPDLTTVSALVLSGRERPVAYLATRAHHADVGSAVPGSMGPARDLFGEGLILPPVLLTRRGKFVSDIGDVIEANSRSPGERRGDLAAQIGAHRLGEKRLLAVLASLARTSAGSDLGAAAETFDSAADELVRVTAARATGVLGKLRRGEYVFEDRLEVDDRVLQLRARVVLGSSASLGVDFAGSADQADRGVNAPLAVTTSAVYYVVALFLENVPLNHGAFAGVTVQAPLGSCVNPTPPAPVAAGNVEMSQRIVDVVLGALAQAAPDMVPAASQGTMNNVLYGGLTAAGASYSAYETLAGGAGGGPLGPGASAIQVHMTNTRNTPIEALESANPVVIERYAVRRGSGGPGRSPGGDGVVRAYRFLAPARLTLVSDRRRQGPWGLAGGSPGQPGQNYLIRAGQTVELQATTTLDVDVGDVLVVETPGGGGWGADASGDGAG